MSHKKPTRRSAHQRIPVELASLEARLLLSTITVNASGGAQYTDLKTAIEASVSGDTILVSPGTYVAHTTAFDPNVRFWINKSLTLESTGGASVTTLSIPTGGVQGLLITASNVTVKGFTINGGDYCVDSETFGVATTFYSNVVLENLNVVPVSTSSGAHGIQLLNQIDAVVDNCTVGTAYVYGVYIYGGNHDTVMNTTINGTVTGHGVYIDDSTNDSILHVNVLNPGFNGIVVDGSNYTTVEYDYVTGDKYGEIIYTNGSDYGVIGLNTLASTQYAQGNTTNGTGVWLNSESDGNYVFGNTITGEPENGIAIFLSSNNLIEGNDISGNYQGGIFVWDTPAGEGSTGNAPANNVITKNYIHNDVNNGAVNLRGAQNTLVTDNYMAGKSTGLNTTNDIGVELQTSNNSTIRDNIITNFQQSIYFYGDSTNTVYYQNRAFNTFYNIVFQPATAQFDDGATLGGNYWAGFAASGDPSGTTPFTNFLLDSSGHTGGPYVDRYPYQDESLGQAYAATVEAPDSGDTLATGSTHVIRWTSTAAVLVDLVYSSSETGDVTIASNVPNTGFYKWVVPTVTPGTDYTIKVIPKNSAGTAEGTSGVSPQFSISANSLMLLSPNKTAQLQAGTTTRVTWSETASTLVTVQLQTNGGSWTNLATNVSADYADVTLPNLNTSTARIRIVDQSTNNKDTQDGYFSICNTAAVTTTFSATVLIQSIQQITWTSPAGAATVTLDFFNGLGWVNIVTQMPDIGSHRWFVPEYFTTAGQVRATFYNASNAVISTATSNTFEVAYTSATGVLVPRYRLYNPITNEHLYTTDANENAVLATRGWQQEGAPYEIYNGPAVVDGVTATPLYRLYDAGDKQHFWTSDPNEYAALRFTTTWTDEGVAGYMFVTQVAGTEPLYRLSYQSSTLHLHLWTTDLNEYTTLFNSDGWSQEGITDYVNALA